MFVTQQIVPRCKEWLPLATNQLRLRNLIQILAFSLKYDGENSANAKGVKAIENQSSKNLSYYYTLHSTTMSAPFYTSEKVFNDSPKWKEIDVNSFTGNVSISTDAFVIRLWCSKENANIKEESEDCIIAVWGVSLNGLTHIGQNLGTDIFLKPNSVVFLMPGGYFTDMNCLETKPKMRYISVAVNQSDIQLSYTVNTLTRLHSIQQVIKKELAEVDLLKQKISMGDYFRSETRGRTMLRRLLSKTKPRISHQEYVKIKENIEIAKYRVQVLREEKSISSIRLKELKNRIATLADENQLMELRIMENYRVLMRKVQNQRELRRDYISRRETQLHSKAKLNFRTKQLISELNLIYPIVEKSPEKYTICGVHLPNSEDFAGQDEIQISVALGFVAHVVQMISVFLQVPLRYPVIHFGSRSRIIDHISDKIPDSEREFPLYLRGKEKLQFHYAVYLLNKNIAQLRWLCGLPTLDLRNTLSNLSSLVKMKSENSNLDHSNRSLSSSTADVCSSCLSISSPVGSILSLSNKKNPRCNRTSESCTDTASEVVVYKPIKLAGGHRISKSVGSAKELMLNIFPENNQHNHRNDCASIKRDNASIINSLSYSLDKGLNEYKNVSGSKPKPLNHMESDSFLKCSGSDERKFDLSESKEKDKFLKSWEADKHCVPFSDDDSDVNVSEFHSSKLVSKSQENSTKCEIKITGFDATADLELKEEKEAAQLKGSDLEFAEEGLLANECLVDEKITRKTEEVELKCDRNIVENSELRKYDEENCTLLADSLLENVTSRTEALANKTTSFNRFRNRFKSTLENSS